MYFRALHTYDRACICACVHMRVLVPPSVRLSVHVRVCIELNSKDFEQRFHGLLNVMLMFADTLSCT
jgi:hypothetical protein